MPAVMQRASYTITAATLQRFNALVPAGERSRLMERYMLLAADAEEARLGEIAEAYLKDPAFAQCRGDEAALDVTVADGLEPA